VSVCEAFVTKSHQHQLLISPPNTPSLSSCPPPPPTTSTVPTNLFHRISSSSTCMTPHPLRPPNLPFQSASSERMHENHQQRSALFVFLISCLRIGKGGVRDQASEHERKGNAVVMLGSTLWYMLAAVAHESASRRAWAGITHQERRRRNCFTESARAQLTCRLACHSCSFQTSGGIIHDGGVDVPGNCEQT
jgi:hypothetical protein